MDLTRPPGAAGTVDEPCGRLGRADVLVNSVGTGVMTPFPDLVLELDVVREVIVVDLVGPLLCGQKAARHMIRQGITVNAVAPGEIATPTTGQEDVDVHTRSRVGVPLGRPGDAREVAAVPPAWSAPTPRTSPARSGP